MTEAQIQKIEVNRGVYGQSKQGYIRKRPAATVEIVLVFDGEGEMDSYVCAAEIAERMVAVVNSEEAERA